MSVNKVILLGNVGKEPDVKYFEPGRGVANFTLATTERAHTTRNDQQIPERTEWHNIVVRGGLVQVVEKYVHKGSKLYIEGKIRSRQFIDRENRERFVTEIVVDELEILSPRVATPGVGGATSYSSQPNGNIGEPIDYKSDDAPIDSSNNSPYSF